MFHPFYVCATLTPSERHQGMGGGPHGCKVSISRLHTHTSSLVGKTKPQRFSLCGPVGGQSDSIFRLPGCHDVRRSFCPVAGALAGLGEGCLGGSLRCVPWLPPRCAQAAQPGVGAKPLPITGHLCPSLSCLHLPGLCVIWGHLPGASPTQDFSQILAFPSVTVQPLESL